METETISVIQASGIDVWTVVSSVAASISALFAAVAAWISLTQTRSLRSEAENDRRISARVRTFEYTPASSPMFFEARQKVASEFRELRTGKPVAASRARSKMQDLEINFAFNVILNHYGRIATAYNKEVIDQATARELYRIGFVRFWHTFELYLNSEFERLPALGKQYEHSASLYREWYSPELLEVFTPEEGQ